MEAGSELSATHSRLGDLHVSDASVPASQAAAQEDLPVPSGSGDHPARGGGDAPQMGREAADPGRDLLRTPGLVS